MGHGGGDRARSEYSSPKKFTGEKWISVSIYLPKDFKSVEPVSTSLFQIYEWGNTNQQRHPRMMLRVKNGNLEPRYFAVNGMDSPGWVKKDLKIDDMREKWTTIIFHANMTKDPLKGFVKMYVNGELYNDYEEELVMEVNFLINLVFITVGLVDGQKFMENIQLRLFIMIIFSELIVKKNYSN